MAKLGPDNVIPSDYYMIQNLLKSKTVIKEVVQDEQDGELLDMDIKDL